MAQDFFEVQYRPKLLALHLLLDEYEQQLPILWKDLANLEWICLKVGIRHGKPEVIKADPIHLDRKKAATQQLLDRLKEQARREVHAEKTKEIKIIGDDNGNIT